MSPRDGTMKRFHEEDLDIGGLIPMNDFDLIPELNGLLEPSHTTPDYDKPTTQSKMSETPNVSTLNGGLRSFKERPCDSCRRRKSRCVFLENESSCMLCKSRIQECTFLEEPQRRRKRRKEEPENMNSISPSHEQSSTTNVADYAMLEGPSLLKKTLGLQNSRFAILLGPTDVLDYSLLSRAEFNDREEAEKELPIGFRLRRTLDDTMFLMQEDNQVAGYERIPELCGAIEEVVAPYGKTLVDLYFRIVHPSYPILHKKVVLEKYSRSFQEFSPPILAAMYLLGLSWWSYAPHLPQDRKPNAERLEQLAIESFQEAIKRPKLSTVQAGLLLLQKQRKQGTWPFLSQLVGIAQDLGLHLDCREWKIPRWEKKLRRRLAWAVWIQDKWNALLDSRPSHLNDPDNWLVAPLTEDDFPDKESEQSEVEGSSDVTNGRLVFLNMIKLTQIVDDILSVLCSLKSVQRLTNILRIVEAVRPIQEKLRQWSSSLPEDIRMSSLKSRTFSSNGYLYLAYLSVEITIHRRIIHSLNSSTPSDLVSLCRNAARERLIAALEFVRHLRPEHVQAFWFSSTTSNLVLVGSFAALLVVTAVDEDEINFFKLALKNYRWMLRVSSVGSEQMAVAVQKLDVLARFLPFMNEDQDAQKTMNQDNDSEYSDDDEIKEQLNEPATQNAT